MIVKVCGVTTPEIAEVAVDAGADWLGLVFEPRSPRHVDAASAEAVRMAAGGGADLIGVMVEPTPRRCQELATRHRLAAVQVHGDIEPGFVVDVDVAVIRAVNVWHRVQALTMQWWPDCVILLDSPASAVGGLPGGTGIRLDLELAAEVAAHRRTILAGGLDPDNVADAIRVVRPDGVDASSGLESSPGVKDPARVRDYVAAARAGFGAMTGGGAPRSVP